MTNELISEAEVEKALDYLRDNAEADAEKRAHRLYLEKFRKSKKALLRKDAEGTEGARDDYAYSHPEYLELLEGLKQAIFEDEKARFLRSAAEIKIDSWRTSQANYRAMKI